MQSEPAPVLSVVVLAWDQLPLTKRCVHAVRANTDVEHELIIVDNGSKDVARRFAQRNADQVVLHAHNTGFAHGMNSGLEVAKAPFIAFVNNDTEVPASWAGRLLGTLEQTPRSGMVVPAVTAAGNAVTVRRHPGDAAQVLPPFSRPPSGVVVVMRTSVCRALGGFSEDFHIAGAEDADLAFKIWVNEMDIAFDPRVLVPHVSKATAGTKLRDWRGVWERNGQILFDKWGSTHTAVPRLEGCPQDRFDRNRAIAAATVEWMRLVHEADRKRLPARALWRMLARPVDRWGVHRRSRGVK